jgi:flagellar protein FlgJ
MITTPYHATPELARAEKTATSEEQRLREACQGFEAIFIHQMMKSMRNATMDGGLVKKSNAEKIFTDMLDQEYADMFSKNMSGGVADMLFQQLKSTLNIGLSDQRPEKKFYNMDKPKGKSVNIEG